MQIKLKSIRPGGLEFCLKRDLVEAGLTLPLVVEAQIDNLGIIRLNDTRLMRCAASNFKYEKIN